MNNRFGNPFGNHNPSDYYRHLYQQNKLMVWLSATALVVLLVAGSGFIHSFFIAYLLFIGSVLYRQFLSQEKMIITLSLSALSGAIAYLLFFGSNVETLQLLSVVVGAAAFGLLTAVATYAPNSPMNLAFIGQVKLKWIVLIIIGLDLLTINPSDLSPRISHIGGVLYGFLSVYLGRNGLNFNWTSPFRKRGPYYKKSNKKTEYQTPPASKMSDEDYNLQKKKKQDEIDAILDKIKQFGYDRLTAEEKRKLFEQSKR
ncbi:MAG: hypothetical protein JXR34_09835 [Bacteroidales bacterium]|nr:hypothetical protein [Bacteroidales bacterium]